jgi:structural maintenance of chromosome 1
VEQYEAIRDKEREQLEELEAARREARTAAEAFQTVQQRRHDAFSVAFEHVAARIDPIYKARRVPLCLPCWLCGMIAPCGC